MSSDRLQRVALAAIVGSLSLSAACTYTEDLGMADLRGTVRVKKEDATITLTNLAGEIWEVTDPRAIGPVYVGVYAGLDDSLYEYPHPEWGPVLGDGAGDAFPYGGGTVGRFAWGCYEATVCKTVSGRYDSYQSVLDFFKDELRSPLTDAEGNEITSAIEFQEKCFQAEYVTSDGELDIVGDTDFVENGDYYEAEIQILGTRFEPGVTVWGFIDQPDETFSFSTCDDSDGDYNAYYDERYYKGTNFEEVLNFPGEYIRNGDLVSDTAAVVDDPEQPFTIEFGFKYED
ncbi:MAG: hypothetical protein H6742_12935 [Alphaproteobacteria bacterium]|nr:hypothetical protein [Alphaproteobacteria bacterium]